MPLKEYNQIKLKDDIRGTLGDEDAIDDNVGATKRTQAKDEVAQYIVDEVVAKDRWPIQMTQLSKETDYSRQHAANVVAEYFEGVDDNEPADYNGVGDPTTDGSPMSAGPEQPYSSGSEKPAPNTSNPDASEMGGQTETKTVLVRGENRLHDVDIEVPPDVDSRSYVRGYLDCRDELTTFTEAE